MPPAGVGDLCSSAVLPVGVQASSVRVFMAFHHLALCCEMQLYHLSKKKCQPVLLFPTQQDSVRSREHSPKVGYGNEIPVCIEKSPVCGMSNQLDP